MQTLYDAASHIAQEIERTRQHLANLELALQSLRPLITIDASTSALPYTQVKDIQTVSDVSVLVSEDAKRVARKPLRKSAASRGTAPRGKKGKATQPSAIPKTGAEVWLSALGRGKVALDTIVGNVLESLSLDASARPVIRNRAGAWLHSAVRSGLVSSSIAKDGSKRYQAAR
jgi:hypothetical protein